MNLEEFKQQHIDKFNKKIGQCTKLELLDIILGYDEVNDELRDKLKKAEKFSDGMYCNTEKKILTLQGKIEIYEKIFTAINALTEVDQCFKNIDGID